MKIRIATWLGLLIGLAGCFDGRAPLEEAASSNLEIGKDAGGLSANSDAKGKERKEGKGARGDLGKSNCDPPPGSSDPNVEICFAKLKDCQINSQDPAQCDELIKICQSLPPSGKPGAPLPPPPMSDVDNCWIKVKQCYVDANDPAICDKEGMRCAELGKPAEPPAVSDVDACWVKIKQCYADAKDPAICDDGAKYCDSLAGDVPPPPPSAAEACWLSVKDCYAKGNDPGLCESQAEHCASIESDDLQ
jgi:hypothetical protein